MTLSDLIPPERVREIAQQYAPPYGNMTDLRMDAITAAAPEIARAVLEWAAEKCNALSPTYMRDGYRWLRGSPDKRLIDLAPHLERQRVNTLRRAGELDQNAYEKCAAMLSQMAKEITDV